MNITGQILTLISYIIFWISRFCKNKKDILFYDNISRVFAIIAFLFLRTYDGIKNTIYVIIRNVLGDYTNKKTKRTKVIILILMIIILFIIYAFDFNGYSTICILICGLFNLYGVIMCNEQGIRLFGLFGSVFYSMFMLLTNNYMGLICEIICFIVMLISYNKYHKKINKSSYTNKI